MFASFDPNCRYYFLPNSWTILKLLLLVWKGRFTSFGICRVVISFVESFKLKEKSVWVCSIQPMEMEKSINIYVLHSCFLINFQNWKLKNITLVFPFLWCHTLFYKIINKFIVDPDGYQWPPTFSNWLKTVFWQFWQFTIFSIFNFWGHFEGLNEGFSGSSS